jgi:hypothetical protein
VEFRERHNMLDSAIKREKILNFAEDIKRLRAENERE